jgi:hypothetical protein
MSFIFNIFKNDTDSKITEPDICDRLKMLSQKELDELDMKIMKYKKSSEITVLDKSLHELQTLVNLKRQECIRMEKKYREEMKTLNDYETTIAQMEKQILNAEKQSEKQSEKALFVIEELRTKQAVLNTTLIDTQKRKDDIKKERDSLADINKKLEQELCEQEAIINAEIGQFKEKLIARLGDSYKIYDTHVTKIQDVINIEIPSIRGHSTTQHVNMANIEKLINLFIKYPDNYSKVNKYGDIFDLKKMYISPGFAKQFIDGIHNIVCHGPIVSEHGKSNCRKCMLTDFIIYKQRETSILLTSCMGRRNPYITNPPFTNINEILQNGGLQKWLETNYKAICLHNVTHIELIKLIENTSSYMELFTLFSNSLVFDVKDYNIIKFLMLIAFIGNNGNPSNLFEVIK